MISIAPIGLKFCDQLALVGDLPVYIRKAFLSFRQTPVKGGTIPSTTLLGRHQVPSA